MEGISALTRRPLLDERLHPFQRARIHHVAGHGLTRIGIRGVDADFELPVEQGLAHRHGNAGFGDDGRDQGFDRFIQAIGWGHAVDQAFFQRLLRIDEVPRHQHLERRLAAQVARQRDAGRRTGRS